ncbi:hypothetical protein CsatA_005653 [Cannabis sativa]
MDVDDHDKPCAPVACSQNKYDVFISFRGEDTRANFVSHLYKGLKDGGIETYIDDRLERGYEISKALSDAINNSKFSIVVFSEKYAYSSWCLDELVHILECMEKKTQIVLPVFYHVSPGDVRAQKRSYAKIFREYEERYNNSIIHRWKVALATIANLSGWHASKNRNEAELVEVIVNHIQGMLRFTISSTKYLKQLDLVGIEKSIHDINLLLSNAPMVGICGMGGLGKTTLADVVFKLYRHQFDSYCFLRNIRELQQKYGSTYLTRELFSKLSKIKDFDDENMDVVKNMLCHKKLLIVLDDLDDLDEYDALLKDSNFWLSSESKVIITSRDQQLLRNVVGDDDNIYNLKFLNDEEALDLFHLHAFKRKKVDESYIESSIKLVKYAQGLPLALKVLGSNLYLKSKKIWESLLKKLKVNPDQGILNVLKISFDGLDNMEKNLFLDIACFFNGEVKCHVKIILEDSDSFDAIIEVLIDKCLITDVNDRLQMHDLLQEMGRSIARGLDHNCSGNYSRLWKLKDIYRFLKNTTEDASTIEGIFPNDSEIFLPEDQEPMNLDPLIFEKMPYLRLLKLAYFQIRCQLPQGLHSFPRDLRYLRWDCYPLRTLGSNFTPHNLVYLSMTDSELEKLWDEFQDMKNLKYVDLGGSKKLTCLPNLSRANIWKLDLEFCTNLVELPPLKFHTNFDDAKDETKAINFYNGCILDEKCDLLLLEGIWFGGLKDFFLNLNMCSNLRIVSEMSGNIKYICLRSTAIEELHTSIGSLNNLFVLDLFGCRHLKNLPSSIFDSTSLSILDMHGCVSINTFPKLPKTLKALDLSGTSIQRINSSSFESMPFLKNFYMNNCTKLESIPTTICKLKSLQVLSFINCSKLKSFPEILEPMENLEMLYLNGTGIEVVPPSISLLAKLQNLDLRECENLKSIPISNIYNMCNVYIFIDENPTQQHLIVSLPFDVNISTMLDHSKCKGSCLDMNRVSFLNSQFVGLIDFSRDELIHWKFNYWKRYICSECFLFYTIHNILVSKYKNQKENKIRILV